MKRLFSRHLVFTFFLFISGVLLSLDSYALKDYNWDGDSGSNWETAGSWDNQPGSQVGFDYGINGNDYSLPGDDHPVIDASTDFTFNGNPYVIVNLEILNDAELTINDNTLNVTGTLLIHSGASVSINNGGTLNAADVVIWDANSSINVTGSGVLAVSGDIGLGDDQGQGDGTNGTPQVTISGNGSITADNITFSNDTNDTPQLRINGGTVTVANDISGIGGTVDVGLAGNGSLEVQGNILLDDAGDQLTATGTSSLDIADLAIDNSASFSYTGASTVTINNSMTLGDGSLALSVTPDLSGSTFTLDGTSAQSVSFAGGVTVDDLVIDNSLGVTLGSDFIVTNNLALTNGVLDVSGSKLTIADNATTSGWTSSNYVHGSVTKVGNDAFQFPLQSGLSISAPSNITDEFTASYLPVSPPYTSSSKDAGLAIISGVEYWVLDRDVGSSSVNVTLSWGAVSGVEDLLDLRVVRWDGSSWRNEGNSATSGIPLLGTITSGAISNFSPFTLGSTSGDNPLPVELIEFSAELRDSQTYINWSTATEINNSHFELHRSQDGVTIETIGNIPSLSENGMSEELLEYSFIDKAPLIGANYYRIKQIDFDGTSKTYPFEFVNNDLNELSSVRVYPNPSTNRKISASIDETHQKVRFSLFHIDGRLYHEEIRENKGDEYIVELPSPVQSGIYFLKMEIINGMESNEVTRKIIIN